MMNAELGGLISHDALTLLYKCRKCLYHGNLVMEYGKDGKAWRLGQYTRQMNIIGSSRFGEIGINGGINGQIIKDCFDA